MAITNTIHAVPTGEDPNADTRNRTPEPPRWLAWLAAYHRTWLAIAAAVPVVLVNAVAFTGQLAFLRAHLPISLPGQVLVAVALESVAIYLAYHAHVAQLADDSAMRLRLAAYSWAAGIAA